MNQAKQLLAKLAKVQKGAFSKKLCLHPDAPKGCSSQIVQAHSVQRAVNLQSIASNNHVLQFKADVWDLEKTSGKVLVKQVSISDATTFAGFCSFHDSSTFRPVEAVPYTATDEQVFLLGYRSLVRELYNKQAAVDAAKGQLKLLPQGDPDDFSSLQPFTYMALHAYANYLGYTEIARQLVDYNEALKTGDYSRFGRLILKSDIPPGFLCSIAINPDHDFSGRHLQDIADLDKPLQTLSMNVQRTQEGADIIFTWHVSCNRIARDFLKSLLAQPRVRQGDAIVRLAFEYADNIAMAPVWWASLDVELQQRLEERTKARTVLGGMPPSNSLSDDGAKYGAFNVVSMERHFPG